MHTAARLALIMAVGISLASCNGDSSGGSGPGGSPSALGTKPSGTLLCGLVPSAAVEQATGRKVFDTYGQTRRTSDGGNVGSCDVVDRSTRDTLVSANLGTSEGGFGQTIQTEARNHAREYTYPPSLGIGTAQHQGYLAKDGKSLRAAVANLLRGNRVIDVVINVSAKGRDPLPDAVAMTLQIAEALNVPDSTPSATGSATG